MLQKSFSNKASIYSYFGLRVEGSGKLALYGGPRWTQEARTEYIEVGTDETHFNTGGLSGYSVGKYR